MIPHKLKKLNICKLNYLYIFLSFQIIVGCFKNNIKKNMEQCIDLMDHIEFQKEEKNIEFIEEKDEGMLTQKESEDNEFDDLINFRFKPTKVSLKKGSYEDFLFKCNNKLKLDKIFDEIKRIVIESPSIKHYELPVWNNLPEKHQKQLLKQIKYKKLEQEKTYFCCRIRPINVRRCYGFLFFLLAMGLEPFFYLKAEQNKEIYYKGCDKDNNCTKFNNFNSCYDSNLDCKKYVYSGPWSIVYNLYPIFFFLVILPVILKYVDPSNKLLKNCCNTICKNSPTFNYFEPLEPVHKEDKIVDLICCRKKDLNSPGFSKCCGCCVLPFWFRVKGYISDKLNCFSGIFNSFCCLVKRREDNISNYNNM